jgi:2-phosphosulfolactate phosphatase
VIDVALTPAGLRGSDVAVVIDVLRATSTITQALAAGYERVLCVDTLERAAMLRSPGRVLAGERRCVMPAGFDQGNSPLDASRRRGRELVLATTNGAPTIVSAARRAPCVMLACMLNLEAVLRALRRIDDRDLQLVCAGGDGAVALEDTYLAGRLSAALPGRRTDAALVAEGVARAFPTPLAALDASADARVLRCAGLTRDIACCALASKLDLVPHVLAAGTGVAAVAAGGHGAAAGGAAVDLGVTVNV